MDAVFDEESLKDLLLMVGVDVPVEIIGTWTMEQRDRAETWAAKYFLAANDNVIRIPQRPDFLPAPSGAQESGE